MKLNKKKIFRWIKIIVLLYAIIGIGLYYLQEKFLFHPVALPRDYKYQFDVPFKETELALNKTDMIPAEQRDQLCQEFLQKLDWQDQYFIISTLTGEGCQLLTYTIMDYLEHHLLPEPEPEPKNPGNSDSDNELLNSC